MRGAGEEVAELLRRAARRVRVAVLTHRNADPDAIASALLARRALMELGAEPVIMLPEGLSRASKQVLRAAGLEGIPQTRYEEGPEAVPRVEAVVVVDSSNTTQLGGLAVLAITRPLFLIDHHSPGDLAPHAEDAVLDEASPSATQLVALALEYMGVCPEAREATVGLAGIIYDTRRYSIADAGSFKASAYLISCGGDYERALKALQGGRDQGSGLDYAERVARLKAAQRMVTSRICEELIVAVTRVGAYESSAARALVDLGADVAVVVGGKGAELRVTLRLSRRALETGLRADELASYIAGKHGGRGGGHAAAGMAHVPAPRGGAEDLVEAIARSLPGKAARICVERRSKALGGGQG
ncbi:MAG: DHH family phosphoesterase [Desulfurococcales archaeon]|nr:DHH family phosphoesterase [Desulfurococcales archaeon]